MNINKLHMVFILNLFILCPNLYPGKYKTFEVDDFVTQKGVYKKQKKSESGLQDKHV